MIVICIVKYYIQGPILLRFEVFVINEKCINISLEKRRYLSTKLNILVSFKFDVIFDKMTSIRLTPGQSKMIKCPQFTFMYLNSSWITIMIFEIE